MAQAPAQAPPQAAPQVRTFYVVSLNQGPNFDAKLPLMAQPRIREHAAYMARLTREGKLLIGGPFVDKPGSMTMTSAVLVLAAESPEEARKIEELDPAVTSGLMTIAEIKPLLGFGGTWLQCPPPQPPAPAAVR
jgi:uncharacterized protein YciI